MMFELRWLAFAPNYLEGSAQTGQADVAILSKILQYRFATNYMERGFYTPIWSEWIDVPVEFISNK